MKQSTQISRSKTADHLAKSIRRTIDQRAGEFPRAKYVWLSMSQLKRWEEPAISLSSSSPSTQEKP